MNGNMRLGKRVTALEKDGGADRIGNVRLSRKRHRGFDVFRKVQNDAWSRL